MHTTPSSKGLYPEPQHRQQVALTGKSRSVVIGYRKSRDPALDSSIQNKVIVDKKLKPNSMPRKRIIRVILIHAEVVKLIKQRPALAQVVLCLGHVPTSLGLTHRRH